MSIDTTFSRCKFVRKMTILIFFFECCAQVTSLVLSFTTLWCQYDVSSTTTCVFLSMASYIKVWTAFAQSMLCTWHVSLIPCQETQDEMTCDQATIQGCIDLPVE